MEPNALKWFADRGFELDLDVVEAGVTLRMAAVPVAADGTVELSESPVALDRLAILFKAQATVDGAMGQLQEAAVQLVAGRLRVTGIVEDVETAELHDFDITTDALLAADAPASGGPRPIPTDEDALDWEDEHTLESMVMATPEAPEDADADEEEDPAVSQEGFERLLQAILSPTAATAEAPDPTQAGALEAPAARLAGAPPFAALPEPEREVPAVPEPGDQLMSGEEEALGFLKILVAREELEIEDGQRLESLAVGARDVLSLPISAERKAEALSTWLLDQPAVADLYIADDDLAEVLAEW
jgi:hypothetical protein